MKQFVPSTTVLERAKAIIAQKKLSLVPERKCFVVEGSIKNYLVRLFRDGKAGQYCTCESTVTCSHIRAAMLYIDYEPKPRNEKPNLTRMKKNANKRVDSKCGTKKSSNRGNGFRNIRRKEAQVQHKNSIFL